MASKKMKGARAGAKVGTRVGAKVAPRAGRAAGKLAWKAGKSEAKLIRRAMSAQQSRKSRYFKYAIFTLLGLAIGAAIARSRKGETSGESSSFTGTTGPHAPDSGSPAGQRGETWGSGTPTGTAGGGGGSGAQTGAERDYSDPASGPLIGEQHGPVEGVGEEQEELEQRIRTNIGEDPRTAEMPRVNVEVVDGVAELRGVAPSEDAKLAAGEIAQAVEGVREVRNLITVS
jgi:hypothetical protein